MAPDVAEYIDAVKPLYPKLEKLWSAVLWTLEHRADQIGEPLAGSTRVATVKLSVEHPVVTVVFKLSEETARILDFEFGPIAGGGDA